MKKILFGLDLVTVVLGFLCLISLSLTVMVPMGASETETAIEITGLHFWEFTSLGLFIMMAPFAMLLVSKYHTRIQNMHLILFGILVLALIGYNRGIILGKEWICTAIDGYVEYKKAIAAYPLLLMLLGSILVVRSDFGDFLDEYEEEYEDYDVLEVES